MFVTPVCSNKPLYNMRRAQLDYTMFLFVVSYQSNQAIHVTRRNYILSFEWILKHFRTQSINSSLNTTPIFLLQIHAVTWKLKSVKGWDFQTCLTTAAVTILMRYCFIQLTCLLLLCTLPIYHISLDFLPY